MEQEGNFRLKLYNLPVDSLQTSPDPDPDPGPRRPDPEQFKTGSGSNNISRVPSIFSALLEKSI